MGQTVISVTIIIIIILINKNEHVRKKSMIGELKNENSRMTTVWGGLD